MISLEQDSIRLEEFRPERSDELVRMWRESFEHGVGVTDPHPLEEQRRYLTDKVAPNGIIRVAILEDRVVGFVAASSDSVAQLYVRKGFHRRGIERHGFTIVARGFEPNWKLEDIRYEWSRREV